MKIKLNYKRSIGVVVYYLIHLELPFENVAEIRAKKISDLNFDDSLEICKQLNPLLLK